MALKAEQLCMKDYLVRLYFWLITFGKYSIRYLRADGQIVHKAFVIPRCLKFPFLKQGDHEIGPCVTPANCRRRGYYYFMLTYITSLAEYKDSDFYMLVGAGNEASVRGIEKAGFVRIGMAKQTRLKNYVTE